MACLKHAAESQILRIDRTGLRRSAFRMQPDPGRAVGSFRKSRQIHPVEFLFQAVHGVHRKCQILPVIQDEFAVLFRLVPVDAGGNQRIVGRISGDQHFHAQIRLHKIPSDIQKPLQGMRFFFLKCREAGALDVQISAVEDVPVVAAQIGDRTRRPFFFKTGSGYENAGEKLIADILRRVIQKGHVPFVFNFRERDFFRMRNGDDRRPRPLVLIHFTEGDVVSAENKQGYFPRPDFLFLHEAVIIEAFIGILDGKLIPAEAQPGKGFFEIFNKCLAEAVCRDHDSGNAFEDVPEPQHRQGFPDKNR